MMKKIVALLLAAVMIVLIVACGETPSPVETTGTTAPNETTASAETTGKPIETTNKTPDIEPTAPDDLGHQWTAVGAYVTLVYNASVADVTFEVKKGLGSRETVTMTAVMRDGFLFDGWTVGNALANDPSLSATKTLSFTYEASEPVKIYLNTSMTLHYHENGGTAKAGFVHDRTYSLVFFQNPNTLPEQGYFTREGYTLTAYNTKADGSGEEVSLGSKVTRGNASELDLYCVWEKNTPETDFEYTSSGTKATITKYKGSDDTVVIPEVIDGKTVVCIAEDAFQNSDIKKVVIAKTVQKVEEYAFEDCPKLETVVIFDGAIGNRGISGKSFYDCDAFKTLCINTVFDMLNEWMSDGAAKFDRLVWAADKKKIIIVGGSGSKLGFNCAMIEEALDNEYVLVNLGENANITSIVYFEMIRDYVREGDIVLWCPEPGTWTLGSRNCSSRFWEFRKADYGFVKHLTPSYYDNLLDSFADISVSYQSGIRKFKAYDAQSINMEAHGDDYSNRVWNQRSNSNYNFNYRFGAKDELTELVSAITEKGAHVWFSFAAMQESGRKEGLKKTDAYEAMITSIPGIVSITDAENIFFADDLFSDSEWHMTMDGAKKRTEQVILDLKAQLAKEGK